MVVKRNYNSIDLMKFILCFLVVAIHSNPFNDISLLLNRLLLGIERLAVPLFFIASGFFLFKGGPLEKEQLVKYLKRMGLLYLAWFIVSIPVTVFNRFLMGEGTLSVKLFQFVKSFFFTSTFSGSWFLTSCVFCTLLFYCIYKWIPKYGKVITIVLSVVAYLLCVSTSSWGKWMDIAGVRSFYDQFVFYFAKPYTSILVGIPYFALGKYIADNEDSIVPVSWLWTILLLMILLFEVWFTYSRQFTNSTDCYLMLLPCAYCVFVYFLKKDIKLKHAVEMRKTSTIVFFSQFIWLFLIEYAEWYLHITIPQMVKFVIALILCLGTAQVILTLSKKPRFRWIGYFY